MMRHLMPLLATATLFLGLAGMAQDSALSGAPQPPPPEVAAQLHDVSPPVGFHPWWRSVDTVGALSIALTLGGMALLFAGIARLRRGAVVEADLEHLAEAIEEAGRLLEALAGEGLYELGSPEAHGRLARELPPILKRFLAAMHGVPVDCYTTRETHSLLAGLSLEEAAHQVRRILASCDELKFAGMDVFAADPVAQAREVVSALAERVAVRGRGVDAA